jgi:hypothetical protein
MPVAASRPARPHSTLPSLFLLCLVLGVTVAPAAATRCGDDVDGRGTRVACACGDVLVSSARLAPSDPLVQAPCPAAGLVVDVPTTVTRPITLDLAGAILAGSGRGVGIEVLAGGPHGIVVTGPGGVRGFDLGIVAREGALASLVAVESSDNVHDGFRLAGRDYRLDTCRADRNGRDGFVLHGEGYRLDGCEAVGNGRDGFAVRGRPATTVADANTADANGRRAARPRSRAQRTTEEAR